MAHDPVAMPRARREWVHLDYAEAARVQDALQGADAVIIMTEWAEYKALDWNTELKAMRRRLVIDTRNIIREGVEGATIEQIGRRALQAEHPALPLAVPAAATGPGVEAAASGAAAPGVQG